MVTSQLSSSLIVPIALLSAMVAPLALLSLTVKVSSCSRSGSWMVGTEIVWGVVEPDVNVSVSDVDV